MKRYPALRNSRRFLTTMALCCLVGACAGSRKTGPSASALTHYYLAETDIGEGDFAAALTHLDSAIAINPRLSNLYRLKGFVYENLQQTEAAIGAYQTCLAYRSAQPDIIRKIGQLYYQRRESGQALVILRRYAELFPDSAGVLLDLAKTYFQMEAYQDALNMLRDYDDSGIRRDGSFEKWMGLTLYHLGRYDAAVASLENFLEQHPGDAKAQTYYAFAIFETGSQEQAMSRLNNLPGNVQPDPMVLWYRSRYFVQAQKPAAAVAQLQQALAIDSTFVKALFDLGGIQYETGDYAGCKAHMNAVLRHDVGFWPAYRYLGLLADREKDYPAARKFYEVYLQNVETPDERILSRIQSLNKRLDQ